jgi:hypothetical protein
MRHSQLTRTTNNGRKNSLCRLCCPGSCSLKSPHRSLSRSLTWRLRVHQHGHLRRARRHVRFPTKKKKIRTTDEGLLRGAIRQHSRSCKHFLRKTVVESSRVDRPTDKSTLRAYTYTGMCVRYFAKKNKKKRTNRKEKTGGAAWKV